MAKTYSPTPMNIATHELGIVAVLVVYERQLDAVQAWPTLLSALASSEGDSVRLRQIVIYHNSPEPRAKPAADITGCTYVHDRDNGGTAAAYTRAAAIAAHSGIDWLLLLDQDTLLSPEYFPALALALAPVTDSATTPAALVPWVYHGLAPISPARLTWAGTIAPLRRSAQPRFFGELTAIASGSVLHVPSFSELMPLPKGLWLDYVDHWIFRCLQMRCRSVLILNQALQHDLSVANPSQLSRRRLLSILEGEAQFQKLLGIGAKILYPIRLAARLIRYSFIQPRLAFYTLAWAFRRPS